MGLSQIPGPSMRVPGGVAAMLTPVGPSTAAAATTYTGPSYTIPANSVAVGTVYSLTAQGLITNGTAQATLTCTLRLGGTTIAVLNFLTGTVAFTNRSWRYEAELIFPSLTQAWGNATIRAALSGALVTGVNLNQSVGQTAVHTSATAGGTQTAGGVTVNTTNPLTLDATFAISATTGASFSVSNGVIALVRL